MGLRKFSYDISLRPKDRPCAHYICLERFARWTKKKERLLLAYFLSYSIGIETTNTFVHSWRSLENQTRFQTSGAETLRFGAAHTYMEYPLSPGARWESLFISDVFAGYFIRKVSRLQPGHLRTLSQSETAALTKNWDLIGHCPILRLVSFDPKFFAV